MDPKDNWTVSQARQLIACYKHYSNLWDYKNKYYKNKALRENCLRNITKQMVQIKPGATIDDIRNKLKTLRCQYAKEKRRREEALAQGSQFKPTLWCYEEIKFIDAGNNPDEATIKENESNILETENNEKEVKTMKPRGGFHASTWTKEQVYKLLLLLKQHPVIYDSTHPLYENPIHRSKAFRDMKNGLESVKPNVTIDEMRSKLKTLRSQYLKDKHIEKRTRNCRGGLPYKPKLWCFKQMKFWDVKGQYLEKEQDLDEVNEDNGEEMQYEEVDQEPELPIYEVPDDCYIGENENEIYVKSFDDLSEDEEAILPHAPTVDAENLKQSPSALHRKCLNLIESVSKQMPAEEESGKYVENVSSAPEALFGRMVEIELAQFSAGVFHDTKWKIIKVLEEASKKQRELKNVHR